MSAGSGSGAGGATPDADDAPSVARVFRGNVVVPLCAPFGPEAGARRSASDDAAAAPAGAGGTASGAASAAPPRPSPRPGVAELCPGLEIRTDHVLAVTSDGFVSHLDHSSSDSSRAILARAGAGSGSGSGSSAGPSDGDGDGGGVGGGVSASSTPRSPDLVVLSPLEYLCPGFVDLHVHAPQFSFAGSGTSLPLTGGGGWLESLAYPAEMALENDPALAGEVCREAVRSTLRCGTTMAVYYGTLNLGPTKALVDAALGAGQRALVGKVCMDRGGPDTYRQSLEKNVEETEDLILYVHERAGREERGGKGAAGGGEGRPSKRTKTHEGAGGGPPPPSLPLVMPVVTPRFLPSCTPQLLSMLGRLASRYGCRVQSHISESIDEVVLSRTLDAKDRSSPRSAALKLGADGGGAGGRTDAEIFDSHSLLTDRSVMAHGVHLTESDASLLRGRGAAVAHCPLSNFFFAGKSLDVKCLMEGGNPVGLGTDVAGGYSSSMFDAMRAAVLASISARRVGEAERKSSERATRGFDRDGEEGGGGGGGGAGGAPPLDYRHAYYLATLGGANALGLGDRIGTFRSGMVFDAVVLSAERSTGSSVRAFGRDGVADVFQKICTLGDDRNVVRAYVGGREVKGGSKVGASTVV